MHSPRTNGEVADAKRKRRELAERLDRQRRERQALREGEVDEESLLQQAVQNRAPQRHFWSSISHMHNPVGEREQQDRVDRQRSYREMLAQQVQERRQREEEKKRQLEEEEARLEERVRAERAALEARQREAQRQATTNSKSSTRDGQSVQIGLSGHVAKTKHSMKRSSSRDSRRLSYGKGSKAMPKLSLYVEEPNDDSISFPLSSKPKTPAHDFFKGSDAAAAMVASPPVQFGRRLPRRRTPHASTESTSDGQDSTINKRQELANRLAEQIEAKRERKRREQEEREQQDELIERIFSGGSSGDGSRVTSASRLPRKPALHLPVKRRSSGNAPCLAPRQSSWRRTAPAQGRASTPFTTVSLDDQASSEWKPARLPTSPTLSSSSWHGSSDVDTFRIKLGSGFRRLSPTMSTRAAPAPFSFLSRDESLDFAAHDGHLFEHEPTPRQHSTLSSLANHLHRESYGIAPDGEEFSPRPNPRARPSPLGRSARPEFETSMPSSSRFVPNGVSPSNAGEAPLGGFPRTRRGSRVRRRSRRRSSTSSVGDMSDEAVLRRFLEGP